MAHKLPTFKIENIRPLKIGIAYESTLEQDILLWKEFCFLAQRLGHQIYIFTYKPLEKMGPIMRDIVGNIDIISCNGPFKKEAAELMGISIDIWVDADPITILGETTDEENQN